MYFSKLRHIISRSKINSFFFQNWIINREFKSVESLMNQMLTDSILPILFDIIRTEFRLQEFLFSIYTIYYFYSGNSI